MTKRPQRIRETQAARPTSQRPAGTPTLAELLTADGRLRKDIAAAAGCSRKALEDLQAGRKSRPGVLLLSALAAALRLPAWKVEAAVRQSRVRRLLQRPGEIAPWDYRTGVMDALGSAGAVCEAAEKRRLPEHPDML